MEPELFKEKMKETANFLKISGTLLVMAQGVILSGYWDSYKYLIQPLALLAVIAVLLAFLRGLFLFVVNKKIMSPVLGRNLSKTNNQAEMRLPFKVMLVILLLLFTLFLAGVLVLNVIVFS